MITLTIIFHHTGFQHRAINIILSLWKSPISRSSWRTPKCWVVWYLNHDSHIQSLFNRIDPRSDTRHSTNQQQQQLPVTTRKGIVAIYGLSRTDHATSLGPVVKIFCKNWLSSRRILLSRPDFSALFSRVYWLDGFHRQLEWREQSGLAGIRAESLCKIISDKLGPSGFATNQPAVEVVNSDSLAETIIKLVWFISSRCFKTGIDLFSAIVLAATVVPLLWNSVYTRENQT